MKIISTVILAFFLVMCSHSSSKKNSNINGEKTRTEEANEKSNGEEPVPLTEKVIEIDYLGQETPDFVPEVFAPGLISTASDESSFEIGVNGREMIFAREGKIMLVTKSDSGWSGPEIAPFSGRYVDGECCFSPDGMKILFASRRTLPGAGGTLNTWVSDRQDNSWSEPAPLESPFYEKTVHAVSIASSGNIYCSGIDRFVFSNGLYASRSQLQPAIDGSHPFIAPDESILLFIAPARGRRDTDIYLSRQQEGTWSVPEPLPEYINTSGMESNPFISPDGRFLFFIRNYDVYWTDLKNLKL